MSLSGKKKNCNQRIIKIILERGVIGDNKEERLKSGYFYLL